jgi:hypothetical protein
VVPMLVEVEVVFETLPKMQDVIVKALFSNANRISSLSEAHLILLQLSAEEAPALHNFIDDIANWSLVHALLIFAVSFRVSVVLFYFLCLRLCVVFFNVFTGFLELLLSLILIHFSLS